MELIVQKSSTKLVVVGFAWKLAGVGDSVVGGSCVLGWRCL